MQISQIFKLNSDENFKEIALKIFQHQAINNPIYADFIKNLNVDKETINNLEQIPFLPIQFFKTNKILSSKNQVERIFSSSGTTGAKRSEHHITSLKLYRSSFNKGFQHFYGNLEKYTVLALLPGYLERDNSSLIYMMNDFIIKSKSPDSGFYLNNLQELSCKLCDLDKRGKKVMLIGVSYALLDLIDLQKFNLNHTIIMETGGMKGKRKEMIKEELHRNLCDGFGVDEIHSEYGMTELLSQAYSHGNGIFETPPWMKVIIRDTEDALNILPHQRSGGINIIDLANFNSCSFIATQDLGKTCSDGSFEIMGRFDNSDIRGCNLLVD